MARNARGRFTKAALPPGAQANPAGTIAIRAAAQQANPYNLPALGANPTSRPNPGPTPEQLGPNTLGPLRYQFPYAQNAIWTPRSGYGTPFAQLRTLADVCPEVRICIETRKDQLTSLEWGIAPKNAAARQQASDSNVAQAVANVRAFFLKPDKRRSFTDWLRMAIEEVLVIDALSIFQRRTRGGDLYALEITDGTTWKVQLGDNGDVPLPPAVAYRQIIYGRPIDGGDCTVDDLLYRPRTVRTHTPYGLSATESVLLTVNAALQRQVWNLNYYTEGTMPEGVLGVPESWTAQQIQDYQTWWDAMLAGDLAARRRIKFIPGDAKNYQPIRQPDWSATWDEWLLKIIAAAFAVPPSELGFTNDVNRASAEQQEGVAYRRGVRPLASYFKNIFDEIIAGPLGHPEIEWTWSGGETEDRLKQARIDDIYVRVGKVSVDELRARDGQPMIGMGPAVFLPGGPVFVSDLGVHVDDDPDTTARDDADAASARPGAPAGSAEPVDQAQPGETVDDDAPAQGAEKAVTDDLRRWRTVAIRDVKARRAPRAFTSKAIPSAIHQITTHGLAKAATVADVVHVFSKASRAVKDSANQEVALRRSMRSFFTRQGKALATHVRDGVVAAG